MKLSEEQLNTFIRNILKEQIKQPNLGETDLDKSSYDSPEEIMEHLFKLRDSMMTMFENQKALHKDVKVLKEKIDIIENSLNLIGDAK